jgi:tetratricopeptide (TPR) repeat protein
MGTARFEITKTLLRILREKGCDGGFVDALHALVGKVFDGEREFLGAIYALTPPPPSEQTAAAILRGADRNFQEAVALLEKAYRDHMQGKLREAIRVYKRSISLFPTAEAHTFLGWAYSFQNRYREAIEECETAISLDPEFGNPYNDIGSYLIALEEPAEAIPWLKQATRAQRYGPRHFPWVNLGRAYEAMGDSDNALTSYVKAHEIEPAYEFAEKAISRLCGPPERLN